MLAGNGPYHPKSCATSDVSEIAGVTIPSNKDRIRMVQMLKNHPKPNTQSEDPRMIHLRIQAQIFKGCLAAILEVRICYPRNMKFTSSTFIFRGGLLGNK